MNGRGIEAANGIDTSPSACTVEEKEIPGKVHKRMGGIILIHPEICLENDAPVDALKQKGIAPTVQLMLLLTIST